MHLRLLFLATLLLSTPPLFSQAPPLPPGVKMLHDVEYVPGGGRAQSLDLYLPEKSDGPRPLIVWIHGGGWRAGTKDRSPAVRLMDAGFAVASVEYRLSSVAIFPAQIEDCKAAIRFLRAHATEYGIDAAHIGVWGSSAGGHLVAMLGTTGDVKEFEKGGNLSESSRVQAVCDFFGPADLLTMGAQSPAEARIKHDAPESPESLLVGGALQENKDKARAASPITYVTGDDAPFLIVHGSADPLVPLAQSEQLNSALKKAGVESTLRVIDGGGHGGKGFDEPEVTAQIRDFFTKHLKAAR
ncbi:MAG: alpha/beta hydrolase [Chthoniobacteraceae bacterium]